MEESLRLTRTFRAWRNTNSRGGRTVLDQISPRKSGKPPRFPRSRHFGLRRKRVRRAQQRVSWNAPSNAMRTRRNSGDHFSTLHQPSVTRYNQPKSMHGRQQDFHQPAYTTRLVFPRFEIRSLGCRRCEFSDGLLCLFRLPS
jgi:hypothetical protein